MLGKSRRDPARSTPQILNLPAASLRVTKNAALSTRQTSAATPLTERNEVECMQPPPASLFPFFFPRKNVVGDKSFGGLGFDVLVANALLTARRTLTIQAISATAPARSMTALRRASEYRVCRAGSDK